MPPKPTQPSSFGERLGALLDEHDEKQVELQKAVNHSREGVRLWLTGRATPDGEKLRDLAAHFGVTPKWLAHGTPPKYAPSTVPAPDLLRILQRQQEQLDRIETKISTLDPRLGRIEQQVIEVSKREGEITAQERELLSRFDEMVSLLGRDISRGQPRSRSAKPFPPAVERRSG